jgi:ADP-heptose:LPS heptosyltransferase
MRNNEWLEEKLDIIWREYFSDVDRINNVTIKFGKKARARLGSIKQLHSYKQKNDNDSVITLTGYFKDERVPEYIIDLTIAHELCHYAHGFSSPHPQASKHPHSGGVVDSELKERGFEKQLKNQKKWLKEVWPTIIDKPKRRIRRRSRRNITLKDAFRFLISG